MTIIEESDLLGITISGETFELKGYVTVTLKVGNKTIKNQHIFVVEQPPCEVLLGLDLLEKIGPFLLDFKGRALHLYTRKPRAAAHIMKLGDQEEYEEWPVTAPETFTIPPRHEQMICANCEAPEEIDLVFEPKRKLETTKQMGCASALVRNKDNTVPVKFMNPNLNPIVIYKGTTIGKTMVLKVPIEQGPKCSIQRTKITPRKTKKCTVLQASVAKKKGEGLLPGLDLSKSNLNEGEKEEFRSLLKEFEDVFAEDNTDLGCLNGVVHKIDTKGQGPISYRPFRTPMAEKKIIEEHVKTMKQANVIRKSFSPWGSRVVLVDKPSPEGHTGPPKKRFCIDFRGVNKITHKDTFPLPVINEVLSSLGNAKYFSSMDLMAGYWQIKMNEEDIEKTAFVTHNGKWEFLRMPFGLSNAGATFQRAMQVVLSGLEEGTMVYIDDIIVFSETLPEHFQKMRQVLSRFRENNLKVKLTKCQFVKSSIKFLGHIVDQNGLKPDPDKVKAVVDYPTPSNAKELQCFLGMVGFYRRFCRAFAKIARPLYNLLKKEQQFEIQETEEQAIRNLKKILLEAPVLVYPDLNRQVAIETDASGYGLGCVLSQWHEEHSAYLPIAYASRVMTKAERNYSVSEQECLGVVWALKKFHQFVYGRKCVVFTDHHALKWLMNIDDPAGRLCRWSLLIQDRAGELDIQYRKGSCNQVPDALSRAPLVAAAQSSNKEPRSFKETQREDKHLKMIITYLENPEKLNDHDRKFYKGMSSQYIINDEGILILRKYLENRERYVVPAVLKSTVMKQYHDDLGHIGITKTTKAIAQKYYWLGQTRDVQDYVQSCHECQQRKNPSPKLQPNLQPITVHYPFHTVGMDILELPLTRQGNKYALVLIDMFSKWPEAVAIPNRTSKLIAQMFMKLVVYRHSCPNRLLTDRAKDFLGETKDVLNLVGIKHITSSGYAPQTNGITERFNRTLLDLLSFNVDKDQANWDEALDEALFTARVTVQASTGFSPFYLMKGFDPMLPLDPVFQYHQSKYVDQDDLSYPEKMQATLSLAWQQAKLNIHEAQKRQIKSADENANEPNYNPGDKVLLNQKEAIYREIGRGAKLGMPWKGPYIIDSIRGKNVFLRSLEDPVAMAMPFHMRRIKPYVERINPGIEPNIYPEQEDNIDPKTPEVQTKANIKNLSDDESNLNDNVSEMSFRSNTPDNVPKPRHNYNLRPRK